MRRLAEFISRPVYFYPRALVWPWIASGILATAALVGLTAMALAGLPTGESGCSSDPCRTVGQCTSEGDACVAATGVDCAMSAACYERRLLWAPPAMSAAKQSSGCGGLL